MGASTHSGYKNRVNIPTPTIGALAQCWHASGRFYPMIQSTTNLLIMLLPALLFSTPQHGAPYPVSAANDSHR